MKLNIVPDTETAIKLLEKIATRKIAVGPRKIEKPLALYGAGDLGRMAYEYFVKIGIEVKFVVDRRADILRGDKFWNDTPILFPEEVSADQKNNHILAVCIVTIPYSPLAYDLASQGWHDIIPFYDVAEAYRNQHPLSNGWFAKPISTLDFNNISDVLVSWADDVSRAHHLQFIAWRLLREEWTFEGATINTKNRYFIPELLDSLPKKNYFTDVGAYHGKVSLQFIDITENDFENIWMIEPDPINLRAIENNLAKINPSNRDKIQILPKVVAQKAGIRLFYRGLGYATQLSELGKNKVEVTTLDKLRIAPTFIKFHLEGGELNALQGAQETISKYRPIITTTSYHNEDGIWKLPKWLMGNLTSYCFFMRLHSWCGTGAVIYCIPAELYYLNSK